MPAVLLSFDALFGSELLWDGQAEESEKTITGQNDDHIESTFFLTTNSIKIS